MNISSNDSSALDTQFTELERHVQELDKKSDRMRQDKNRTVINNDQRWEEEMSERLRGLEVTCRAADDRAQYVKEKSAPSEKKSADCVILMNCDQVRLHIRVTLGPNCQTSHQPLNVCHHGQEGQATASSVVPLDT